MLLIFLFQIVHRNREPHSGTMFSKTVDSSGTKTRGMSTPGLFDMDEGELEKLRTDNERLKSALEQVCGCTMYPAVLMLDYKSGDMSMLIIVLLQIVSQKKFKQTFYSEPSYSFSYITNASSNFPCK